MTRKGNKSEQPYFVYGFHTVRAVLENQPHRALALYLAREKSNEQLKNLAARNNIFIHNVDRGFLESKFKVGSSAQGALLTAKGFSYTSINDIFAKNPQTLLVLDGIQDPINLGKIARSAKAFGIDALIIPKDRACEVNAAVEKSAVGALCSMPVVRVTNVAQTLDKLKEDNFFVYGACEKGEVDLPQSDFAKKSVIVIGQEGQGIRPLVKKSCDMLVKIPSQAICLNAADAALLFMYQLSISKR